MPDDETGPIDPRLEKLFWELAHRSPANRMCMFDPKRDCNMESCSGFRIQNMLWKLPTASYGKQIDFTGAIVFMTEYCTRASDFMRPLRVIATLNVKDIDGFMLHHMLPEPEPERKSGARLHHNMGNDDDVE